MRNSRNRVFGRIYASQPIIIEKTRFLATRASAESGFRSIKGVPKNQELISPLSEDFRYETGVFNPWRTIGLTHNLSHSKVFAFTHNTAGESIPRRESESRLKPTGKSNSIIINKFWKKPGFWPRAIATAAKSTSTYLDVLWKPATS